MFENAHWREADQFLIYKHDRGVNKFESTEKQGKSENLNPWRVVQYTQLESIRLWYLRFDKLEIDS